MTTKKFSEAMGEIGDSYLQEAISYQKKRKNQSLVKWAGVAACFAVVIASVVPFLQGQSSSTITPNIDDPNLTIGDSNINITNAFTLVAYTTDTKDTILTANYVTETTLTVLRQGIKAMLPTYSPLLSNVPGFPFTINFADDTNGEIKISVDNGGIVQWSQETGVISEIDNESSFASDTTFYWSPLSTENTIVESATITIYIQNDKNTVATQNVSITSKDNTYYATIDELISIKR